MKQFDTHAKCPLDGVRIVDLSRVVAGNMVSLALADFGAEARARAQRLRSRTI